MAEDQNPLIKNGVEEEYYFGSITVIEEEAVPVHAWGLGPNDYLIAAIPT